MLSLYLAAFAALSSQVVSANKLVERQGPFPFCADPGVMIASRLLVALNPLVATQSCYSILGAPTTTSSITVTSTIVTRPLETATVTTGSGASTLPALATITATSTITVPSSTTTVTTFSRGAQINKRQSNGKGKNPGNGGGSQPTGAARSSACSCILGPDPTFTLALTSTTRTTVTSTSTTTSTSFTLTATVTSTSTLTESATQTVTNGVARATQTVAFQRVYNNQAGGNGYSGNTIVNAATENGCIQQCANNAACLSVFAAAEAGTFLCVLSVNEFSDANLTNDPLVLSARAFNRGTSTPARKMRIVKM